MPGTTPYSHPSRYARHWLGIAERLQISIHPGTGAHTILFAHGLGASSAFFDSADSFHLRGVTLVRLDFLDHGGEEDERMWDKPLRPMDEYTDPMEAFADQLEEAWRETHGTGTVHLVSHGMGTVPALILHERLRTAGTPLTGRFITIEGNLTGPDCDLISRQIGAMAPHYKDWEFGEGPIQPVLEALARSRSMAERRWGAHLRSCWPPFLTHTAASLVAWCDSGRAADLWRGVDAPAYLYGERTGFPQHHRDLLADAETVAIGASGHFPMIDNPQQLWLAVGRAMKTGRR